MNIITTTEELASACEILSRFPYATIDTEFLRETTYWPHLCVIQMACTGHSFIVDAEAEGLSLQPFFELMANESVVKVFHAARQDVEIIYKHSKVIPTPLFDSQVAAMVCGFGDSISYDQLVYKITGAKIDKSSRFTNWSRRPLTQKQIDYAIADVTHLRDVYLSLKANLEEQDRTHWVEEEMAILRAPSTYHIDPPLAWKRMKMRIRKPIELAVLKELAEWREAQAQERNVPRGRVLKDDAIFEIATQRPKNAAALGDLRSLSKGFERSKWADGILAAVARAMAIPQDELPSVPRGRISPEGASATVDLLKVLLKMTAEANGVAAKVIATVDDLDKIASNEHDDCGALKGWRYELFGKRALAIKSGELALKISGPRVAIHTIENVAE